MENIFKLYKRVVWIYVRYISMKASEIIARARSIADIPQAKYVSYDDELKSINESYKDVYSALTNNDDDYFVTETQITMTPAMLVTNTLYEYLVPLPSNFFKLRYVDYQIAGQSTKWAAMKKFPLSLKDESPSEPYYRLQGNNLWVICSNFVTTLPILRIGYYPPPDEITLPDLDLQYGTAVAPNNFALITSPGWMQTATKTDYGFYDYNAQNITSGSVKTGTTGAPVTLLGVGANISNLVYYKGYLYWLQAADIYRAPTDMVTTPIVSARITLTADVTSFSIFNDLIYYSPGATIATCTLAGASITTIYNASAGSSMCVCHGLIWFVDASNNLRYITAIGASTIFRANVTAAATDGTYIFTLETDKTYNRISFTATVLPALHAVDTLRTDVRLIGPWYQGRLPIITSEGQKYLAISDQVDYDFAYPENIVPEIMAFQCAVDFKAKKQADTTELKERLNILWTRFASVIKRDEYRPTRIKQEYDHWGWGIR